MSEIDQKLIGSVSEDRYVKSHVFPLNCESYDILVSYLFIMFDRNDLYLSEYRLAELSNTVNKV